MPVEKAKIAPCAGARIETSPTKKVAPVRGCGLKREYT